ncbi:thiamineS protein [Pyrolobus fumarii 1A]|uniref:ThiamineS protein n=1 Tax=Pyrolobus fumarii (strain DSM 11204 / 1A) TaxID=694429 RepID=G0EFF0_PYRF1|nr:MoaD/ThiS family protein [Pyrolobus fumarii]AEM38974.1 thiamineS protein [Pyrolobus fumarii 1A]
MIRVRVRLLAGLAAALGHDKLVLELPEDAKVATLLEKLMRMSEKLRAMIEDDEMSVVVLVNGKPAHPDTRLRDNSEVVIAPGMVGG